MALQSQTYANSGDPYYGKPSDWSLFSTLTSTIRFNDTDATLRVIPAVPDSQTTITFNNEQLAYVSDIPDLANWAQFPANNNVTIPDPYSLNAQVANISSITVSTLTVNETTINIITTDLIIADEIRVPLITNSTITITADNGVSLFPSAVSINTNNGLYGTIDLTANPGLAGAGGGNISLTANGGTAPGGLFGQINIVANEGTANPGTGNITTGGYINIQANSGALTSPSLTSRIDLNAGGLNLYSGILSPITSEFGYTFMNASAGVSIVAGNFSPSFQVPGSIYLYGTTGVVLGGDAYAGDIYPRLDNSLAPPTNLNIYGRTTLLGNAFVNINSVDNLNFDVNGETKGITGLSTINSLPLSEFQYTPNPAFSTITMFNNGRIEVTQIKNTFAGEDLTISQENGTGRLSLEVYVPPSVTPAGQIVIRANGAIELNAMLNEGITINPTGDILTFQTAGVVNTGQINNLSTINGNDVNNPTVTNIRASGTVFTNEIRSQSPNLGSLMRIDLNDDVANAITLTHPSAPTGGVRIIEAFVGPGVLEVGSITNVSSINGLSYPPINFVDNLQFYVAPNGNNITGTGSQQNPFLTIARALTARATLSTGIEVSIIVASGTYTETFTLLRNTYLVGVPTGDQRLPCNITGDIEMNDTTGSMGLANLQINGSVSMNGVGGNYSVFGCNITFNGTAIAANSGTVFITESRINNTLGVCISSAATLLLRDCLITTTNTDSCIVAAANTTIRQCVITSSAAPGNAEPLVKFINANPATTEILFCKIQFLNGSTDTGANKCCIQYDGASTANSSVFSCLLICEGAIRANPGGNIQCIQDTGSGAVNLSYGLLRAGATAHHIASSIIKTEYNNVP